MGQIQLAIFGAVGAVLMFALVMEPLPSKVRIKLYDPYISVILDLTISFVFPFFVGGKTGALGFVLIAIWTACLFTAYRLIRTRAVIRKSYATIEKNAEKTIKQLSIMRIRYAKELYDKPPDSLLSIPVRSWRKIQFENQMDPFARNARKIYNHAANARGVYERVCGKKYKDSILDKLAAKYFTQSEEVQV